MKRFREVLIHVGAFLLGYYVTLLLEIAMPNTMSGPSFDRTGLVLYFVSSLPQLIGWSLAAFVAGRFTRARSPLPGALALAALFALTYFSGLTFGPTINLLERMAPVLPILLVLALVVYVYFKAHAHRGARLASA